MRLAIFDYDGTVMRANSWHEFFRLELRRRASRAPALLGAYVLRRTRIWTGPRLRDFALRGLRGLSAADVEALGQQIYRGRLAPTMRADALAEIQRRRAEGYRIVIASGAFDFLVVPFAREVSADVVVSTKVAFADGRCCGSIAGVETLGRAKSVSLAARFENDREIEWAASCAYTDSALDVPMLELVGERWLVTGLPAAPAGFPDGTRCCSWDEV